MVIPFICRWLSAEDVAILHSKIVEAF